MAGAMELRDAVRDTVSISLVSSVFCKSGIFGPLLIDHGHWYVAAIMTTIIRSSSIILPYH